MNYCTSCLRELNGVLSCPGCGAVGEAVSGPREPRSNVRIREAAGPSGRRPVPPRVPTGTHAVPRTAVFAAAGTAAEVPERAGFEPAGSDRSRRVRHSHRRRSLAARVTTATGGFAGIAVLGSLAIGSLSTTAHTSNVPGSVSAASAPSRIGIGNTNQNPGSLSTTQPQAQTTTSSTTRSTSSAAAQNPTTTAGSTAQSATRTQGYTPRHAAQTTAQSATTTAATTTPAATPTTSASTKSTAATTTTTSTTPAATPSTATASASPTASSTQSPVLCVLGLCL